MTIAEPIRTAPVAAPAVQASPRPHAEQEMLLTGSEAIAYALKAADVDIMAAYPIRPYDAVMQAAAKMIANGDMDCEYIVAAGEHSQFEIVKHASAVGARSFVGSSGVGWFYAFEAIAVTAGLRLPVVANIGNRALDDPGAFGVEHNDALAVRDLGWLLTWVEHGQEAFDATVIAYKVAEDPRVSLPIGVCTDGAFLTHSQHLVKIPPSELVREFLPKYDLGDRVFHPDNPITIAPQVDQDWLTEIRKQNDVAMRRTPEVIRDAYREFYELFGRQEHPFLEEYMTDDAEFVLVGQGTIAMPGRVMVRRLREQGHKIGFVRLKWFRPFPTDDVVASLSRFKGVGIIDRDYSYGSPHHGGTIFTEVRAAFYDVAKRPAMVNFIGGLGGREFTAPDGQQMFQLLQQAAAGDLKTNVHWIGVRD
ncbi:MAG: pyruvate ferredoxin oxidoreductase [Chloroflexota bacterium]|nr:pyruvate ferredoxin oxidoreductase [Chloroflexota bacterium]